MKKMLISAVFAVAALGAAEVCQQLNTPEAWAVPKYAKPGNESLILPGVPQVGAESIEIAKDKVYTLSGEFRTVGEAAANAGLLIGFQPKTADGTVISAASASPVSLQLGELVEAVAAGSSELRVKGIDKWLVNKPFYRVVFNAENDCSDLPNFNLSTPLIPGELKPDATGVYTLKLKTPLAKAYPTGTRIRLHAGGDLYIFVGLSTNPKKLTGEWQRFSGKVSFAGGPGCGKWYIGTAGAVVAILPLNVNRLEVRDLQVTEE